MSASSDVHFYNELRRQTDVVTAGLMLSECAAALGWDLAAFHIDMERADLPRVRDGRFLSTAMGWRTTTVNEWVRLGFARSCPVGQHCIETTEPFVWDCEVGSLEWRCKRVAPEQRAVLNHYMNDVCGGVTVPVHRAGKTGFVSWCTRDRGALRRTYQATLSSMHLISHTFMRQLDRLHDERPCHGGAKSVLTPREAECLTWAARGRTTEEIATLLGRSTETVEFHISNAIVKLNARNRTHAVAIACGQGIVAGV